MNVNFFNPEHELNFKTDLTEPSLLEIVIHVQQRNGKKAWTIVSGLDQIPDFNVKKNVKMLKKRLSCNASIKVDKDSGLQVVSFQGSHANILNEYLLQRWKLSPDEILIKGV